MELARSPAEGFMAAIVTAAAFRRAALEHAEVLVRSAALEHAEREEARERGQAEHQSRLPTGELRCRPHQVLDGLPADVSRKLLHALGRTASEARELRSVRIEVSGGATHGPRQMARQIGAARHLHVQKAFGLWLASDASEAAASFAWLPACCAASVTFEMASPALARMSCATPDAVGWVPGRDEDVELLEEEGY